MLVKQAKQLGGESPQQHVIYGKHELSINKERPRAISRACGSKVGEMTNSGVGPVVISTTDSKGEIRRHPFEVSRRPDHTAMARWATLYCTSCSSNPWPCFHLSLFLLPTASSTINTFAF
ncbi:hypothetical protein HCEG_02030 [Histoplasma capsulatum var. duboisii H88]|uniref:Uncharacterized protein n=1 Tax=Ajellomyces capsulatus (strain H88) TaxID=544711 RepID=F0UA43_AJEC8|nr:hypothetical protein HCEG_02030 [Histoplasma capsulatum var. duboisii H88]